MAPLSFLSALLAASAGVVSAIPAGPPISLAPKLSLEAFKTLPFHGISLEEAKAGGSHGKFAEPKPDAGMGILSTCDNPRIRVEWDSASDDQRRNYVNAVRCLLDKPPSGQFPEAQNRYEDLVVVHQRLTPNVHGNAKFLLWHRFFLWAFEDILRTECGYNAGVLWFDETRYAGRFQDSSVFSSAYYGRVDVGGNCVPDGAFAYLTLNIGPGSGNTPHCLARNHDPSQTINTGSDMVNACNGRSDYADMAACSEGGAHAWGHNGIGAVMQDVYASPGDPSFFLHHAFIDRNFRIWQNSNYPARVQYVDGTNHVGQPLTLDTGINIMGLRPDMTIGDVLDTMQDKLCYKYNY